MLSLGTSGKLNHGTPIQVFDFGFFLLNLIVCKYHNKKIHMKGPILIKNNRKKYALTKKNSLVELAFGATSL